MGSPAYEACAAEYREELTRIMKGLHDDLRRERDALAKTGGDRNLVLDNIAQALATRRAQLHAARKLAEERILGEGDSLAVANLQHLWSAEEMNFALVEVMRVQGMVQSKEQAENNSKVLALFGSHIPSMAKDVGDMRGELRRVIGTDESRSALKVLRDDLIPNLSKAVNTLVSTVVASDESAAMSRTASIIAAGAAVAALLILGYNFFNH